MPTCGENFTYLVEGCPFWSEHNVVLFSQAQVTAFFGGVQNYGKCLGSFNLVQNYVYYAIFQSIPL